MVQQIELKMKSQYESLRMIMNELLQEIVINKSMCVYEYRVVVAV